MICLPDVNVWLALVVKEHVHHSKAQEWNLQTGAESVVLCRITELGLFRLLTNHRVMDASPLTASAAWKVRDRLFDDSRVSFLEEPQQFDENWRRTSRGGNIGPNFWTDAYLSSLCSAAGCTLVTFDKALARQKRCEVILLGAN